MNSQVLKIETNRLSQTLRLLTSVFNSLKNEVGDLYKSYEEGLKDVAKELKRDDAVSAMSQLNKMMASKGYINKIRYLQRLKSQLPNPYFAKIVFSPKSQNNTNSYYLGRFSFIPQDKTYTDFQITDWRSPIASIYYNYPGPAKEVSYMVPVNERMPYIMTEALKIIGELKLRRNIDIEDQKIIGIYDNNLKVDLLSMALEQRSGGALEDIVETIQEIQNEIIRSNPDKVCLVQGTAGSGKTTVAIHRISYLFYTYPKEIKEKNTLLLTTSKVLVNYVAKTLPELEVYELTRDTLLDYLRKLLNSKGVALHLENTQSKRNDNFLQKNTFEFIKKLEKYTDNYENKIINYLQKQEYSGLLNIKSYIEKSRNLPFFERIENLIEDFKADIEVYKIKENRGDITIENICKQTKKALSELSKLKKHFNPVKEYWTFLEQQNIKYRDKIDIDDISGIYYLYYLLTGSTPLDGGKYAHIVVDEAQDLGILNYTVLRCLGTGSGFTILGDLNQATGDEAGIKHWEELNTVFGKENIDFYKIKVSYRTTKQIMIFARKILEKFSDFRYLPEPFHREGPLPVIKNFKDKAALLDTVVETIKALRKGGDNKSIGIVEIDPAKFEETKSYSKNEGLKYFIVDRDFENFTKTGVFLIPEGNVKGLEFDTVFVLNPNKNLYPNTAMSAKRLFVLCTRAINNLYIYHLGNLSELL